VSPQKIEPSKTLKVSDFKDYRDYLKAIIAQNKKIKSRFPSLALLSKKINLSPSLLTMVLQKKRNLSLDSVEEIAKALQISNHDTEELVFLHLANTAKNRSLRRKFGNILYQLSIEKKIFKVEQSPSLAQKVNFDCYPELEAGLAKLSQLKSDNFSNIVRSWSHRAPQKNLEKRIAELKKISPADWKGHHVISRYSSLSASEFVKQCTQYIQGAVENGIEEASPSSLMGFCEALDQESYNLIQLEMKRFLDAATEIAKRSTNPTRVVTFFGISLTAAMTEPREDLKHKSPSDSHK
jgi:hypothetical protein